MVLLDEVLLQRTTFDISGASMSMNVTDEHKTLPRKVG